MILIDNLRPGEALRWKVEDHQLERSGSSFWQAGTSKVVAPVCVSQGPMGWPPWASIKRTNRMLVVMGLVNRCNLLSIDSWLSLLLQWVCWERNWVADLWITYPGWRFGWEPFFLGAVGSIQRCWWLAKGCHVRGPTWKAYIFCVLGFPLQDVHRFKSPRLSDMSNRLSRGSLHIAN
jgi:hypothetical protein